MLPDPVDILSNGIEKSVVYTPAEGDSNPRGSREGRRAKHRLLISTLQVESRVFSYAVPSIDNSAFLRSWGQLDAKLGYPLVGSSDVRVFLKGSFAGTTNFDTIQPGGNAKFNLGKDNNLVVESNEIVPQNHGTEEDKSTWFITDKRKFRVKTNEIVFSVKSTHETNQLVIVSETLPKSSDADIQVELLIPDKSSLMKDIGTDQASSYEQCLGIVLDEVPSTKLTVSVFVCKISGNIIWAQWVLPQSSLSASLKYKVAWPEDREIYVS